jgi:hypothetical protein
MDLNFQFHGFNIRENLHEAVEQAGREHPQLGGDCVVRNEQDNLFPSHVGNMTVPRHLGRHSLHEDILQQA